MFGYLETTFAAGMLIGGPLFGRFGDIFGARMALTLAMAASASTYFILSVTNSIPLLFLSRLPGFFMHAFHGAQMVMTDVSGHEDRADALGKLGVSYGLGMAVGPYIGGYFSTHYSEQFASGVAGTGCIIAIAIIWMFVPKSTKKVEHVAAKKDSKDASIFNLKAILSLLRVPAVTLVITLRLIVGIPAGVWQSMFAIVNIDKFGLTPQQNGYFMSYIGVLTILMQGFGVKILTKTLKESVLLKLSLAAITVGYFILIFAEYLWIFISLMPFMVAGGALLNVITNSAITKAVDEKDTGTVLGLNMASNSMVRLFSPTLGGYIYSMVGFFGFGMLGFVMNGLTTLALLTCLTNIQLPQ
jgi:OCT family organic cation transporter-like MFS transporter 18